MIPVCERTGRRLAVADTGVGSASENIRIDRARLGACARGEALPLLRFYRPRPAAVVGYPPMAARELRLDSRRRQGTQRGRAPTGGGARCADVRGAARWPWSGCARYPGARRVALAAAGGSPGSADGCPAGWLDMRKVGRDSSTRRSPTAAFAEKMRK